MPTPATPPPAHTSLPRGWVFQLGLFLLKIFRPSVVTGRPAMRARHFLFGLIFLSVLVMGERIVNLFSGFDNLRAKPLVTQVQAELASDDTTAAPEAKPEEKPEAKTEHAEGKNSALKEEKKENEKEAGHAQQATPHAAVASPQSQGEAAPTSNPGDQAKEQGPRQTSEPERELTEGERDTLNQLSKRREVLDARENMILQKEALLKATEKRLDEKLKEMQGLKSTLDQLLGNVSEQQAAELDNLVKIYGVMKPPEAARIMGQMEIPEMLRIISRMKPAQAGPILAAMEPARAKEVTSALTQKSDLPTGAPTSTP